MKNPVELIILTKVFAVAQFSCSTPDNSDTPSKATFTDDAISVPIPSSLSVPKSAWGKTLKYATPNSICYDNELDNCEVYGRLYTYKEATTACPKGLRLPMEADWQYMEQELGMTEAESSAIRVFRGQKEGKVMIERLSIKFAGIKHIATEFVGKDELVYYWAAENGPSGKQFAIYRMLMRRREGGVL